MTFIASDIHPFDTFKYLMHSQCPSVTPRIFLILFIHYCPTISIYLQNGLQHVSSFHYLFTILVNCEECLIRKV